MPRARNSQGVRRRPVAVRAARSSRRSRIGSTPVRIRVGRIMLIAALVAAGLKLMLVQGFEAAALSAQAQQQRFTPISVPAQRGSIVDRNGRLLAFSVDARALFAQPREITKQWDAMTAKERKGKTADQHKQDIAAYIHQVLGDQAPEQAILDALRQDVSGVYLADNVDPAKAALITKQFPTDIAAGYRSVREYPNGPVAADIVGSTSWQADAKVLDGRVGLENSQNALLAGKNGLRVADTGSGNNNLIIPGTERDQPVVPGSSLELTIDADLQYTVQQMLSDYLTSAGAQGGSAVVLDAHTGQVYALANNTFDPNNPSQYTLAQSNPAVTTPFEPGSVNKVVTAAAAIQYGVATPDTVINVPGSLTIADRTVKDWWTHNPENLTLTGVFAKSSNVGTLLTAQKVGQERYYDTLIRFGLGQPTNVGLPGESAGIVPPLDQWSGSTFGNLPIGQGLSMTILQMAGMYQAIANNGVRVPPRIIRAVIGPDGVRHVQPTPAGVTVVSPQTATTVRNMLRAVMQNVPNNPAQTGTGISAALPGYQISGKTGTAQQIDPTTKAYSSSLYWITFAGILPADNPRFVVGIMLDRPTTATGQSAAPLFHDIASYLTQHYQIPLSPPSPPPATLIVR